jgi:uncharacterized membrane protein
MFKIIKKIVITVIRVLEHNTSEHSTKIRVFDTDIYVCSRCLGAYTAGIIFYFIFGAMYLAGFKFPFEIIFIISFAFGSITLIDWATVEVLHIRQGSNTVRLVAGYFLGVSFMLYFWLLPASWWFRFITLLIYGLVALFIAYLGERKRNEQKAQTN